MSSNPINIKDYTIASEIAGTQQINDVRDFVLKNPLKLSQEILRLVANQISFNQNIISKIPSWSHIGGIIAPEKVSLEQSSSEWTAKYKSKLVNGNIGLDLTGGLGVDAFFLSKNFKKYIHNEPNQLLSSIVAHNFKITGKSNTTFTQQKAEDFKIDSDIDFIYLDPSRRDDNNHKMVGIQDCSPDLSLMLDKLITPGRTIMVKYSPMLDIKAALLLLKYVHQVLILSEKNEVKELVFLIEDTIIANPEVICVNLTSKGEEQQFSFDFKQESETNTLFSEPMTYLYEPNASIMKAGAFKSVGNKFLLGKIAPNSHLYTSDIVLKEFPGRIFAIEKVLPFDKKILGAEVPSKKANISVRNFPLSVNEIRKQLNWQDGGEQYIFFTENSIKKKLVIICKKIHLT